MQIKSFSLIHSVQTGFDFHLTYLMASRVIFLEVSRLIVN
jgi:hypothetical protein